MVEYNLRVDGDGLLCLLLCCWAGFRWKCFRRANVFGAVNPCLPQSRPATIFSRCTAIKTRWIARVSLGVNDFSDKPLCVGDRISHRQTTTTATTAASGETADSSLLIADLPPRPSVWAKSSHSPVDSDRIPGRDCPVAAESVQGITLRGHGVAIFSAVTTNRLICPFLALILHRSTYPSATEPGEVFPRPCPAILCKGRSAFSARGTGPPSSCQIVVDQASSRLGETGG